MNIKNSLNQFDCTFYFLINEKDRTIVLKERTQREICRRLKEVVDVRFYGMRSGSDIRSSYTLKDEFRETIPEQINVVLIDREKDEVSLLSQEQRDISFERVTTSEQDLDTLAVALEAVEKTENG